MFYSLNERLIGKRIIYLILFSFLIIKVSSAQQDSLATQNDDSLSYNSAGSAIWRSAVLPGWGQIYQERLVPGAIFGFSATSLYFQSFYYLEQFNKYKLSEDYDKFKAYLSGALFFHVLNLVDVADAAYHEKPTGWQGSLLGDKPLKSPWGAVLRSAIIPGWGQAYNESYFKAAGYFLLNGFLIYKIRIAHTKYLETGDRKDREERSLYSWYFGLSYLITLADAYAGAYLYKFDEAMEMTVSPEITPEAIGLRLYVKF